MRPATLRTAVELAIGKPHGTRARYEGGCHCVPCRAAKSRYNSDRYHARKRGEGAAIIDAAEARAHIFKLSRAGVGRRVVAELSGVSETAICRIRAGTKPRIRESTARAILAVTARAKAPGALVPARKTWRLIGLLLSEGYRKGFIARQLGSKRAAPGLQIRHDRITKGNALKVERLYHRLTA